MGLIEVVGRKGREYLGLFMVEAENAQECVDALLRQGAEEVRISANAAVQDAAGNIIEIPARVYLGASVIRALEASL